MAQRIPYTAAVCKEMVLRKSYIGGERLDTIYFGGGTPSQLPEEDFKAIFEVIYANFEVNTEAEITIEANPDDLTDEYVTMLRRLPFNRISIGIQSFNDEELKFLNRRHDSLKAKQAVARCQKAGFNNISIDLMYGLPNQTMDTWKQNLAEAIALGIQHISSYHLIYEKGTKLYQFLKQGSVQSIEEELSLAMFTRMIEELTKAGFLHYEISSFGKENLFSRHNSSYWVGTKYLGLGPSAHSFDGQNRAFNVLSISKYIAGIASEKPNIEIEVLDKKTQYNDFIITGMRTMWGVDLQKLERIFGTDLLNYCMANVDKYLTQGQVKLIDNHLKLSREGIFISDGIMSDLMYVD